MELKHKRTRSGNIAAQRSRSSYDEMTPGPSFSDSWSEVFPADAAVATVSKDNTFFLVLSWMN